MITWKSIGIDDETLPVIKSRLNDVLGSRWNLQPRIQTWFPRCKGDAKEAHEILLAASYGLLSKAQLKKLEEQAQQEQPQQPQPQPQPSNKPNKEKGEKKEKQPKPDKGEGEDGEGEDGEGEDGEDGEGEDGESEDGESEDGEGEDGEGEDGEDGEDGEGEDGEGEDGEGEDGEDGEDGEGDDGEGEGKKGRSNKGDKRDQKNSGDNSGEGGDGHADEDGIMEALKNIFGKKSQPVRYPDSQLQDQHISDQVFNSHWKGSLSKMVNSIKETFQALAKTETKRHKRTGRLDLKSTTRIQSDSQFVFQKKLKGTNRRVAVASCLDFSSSMLSGAIMGMKEARKLQKNLLKFGFVKQATELSNLLDGFQIAATKYGKEVNKNCYNGKLSHKEIEAHADSSVSISIYRDNIDNLKGSYLGMSSNRSVKSSKPSTSSPYATVRLLVQTSASQFLPSGNRGHGNIYLKASEHGEEVVTRFAAVYQRLHGQWIGANLIRSAFRKCGIAQWWGGFDDKARTIRDWNQTHGSLPSACFDLGGTNTATAVATMIKVLKVRPEERKIAIVFSDGSFGHADHQGVDASGLGYNDQQRRITLGGAVKKAWQEGIEIYYIGLQIGMLQILEAEKLIGKGHAISISDVATEMPQVLEEIIRMDEKDLKTTSKGDGFKLKR